MKDVGCHRPRHWFFACEIPAPGGWCPGVPYWEGETMTLYRGAKPSQDRCFFFKEVRRWEHYLQQPVTQEDINNGDDWHRGDRGMVSWQMVKDFCAARGYNMITLEDEAKRDFLTSQGIR